MSNTAIKTVSGLLRRGKGCTGEELKKALGWPSINVYDVAKTAKLPLFVDKTSRPHRYYGLIPGNAIEQNGVRLRRPR